MTTDEKLARVRAEERIALARARVALGLGEQDDVALLARLAEAVDADTTASRCRAVRMRLSRPPRQPRAGASLGR